MRKNALAARNRSAPYSAMPQRDDDLDGLSEEEADAFEKTPELSAELDRRLQVFDEGRERTYSWDEVRDGILKGRGTTP
jgi:hypothetical protein